MSDHKYAVAEWLHLYPQSHWHDEAHIVGTREGLLALRAALDAALADDHGHYGVTVFANDGEGYCVGVACVPLSEMERMATPYTDEVARGRGGMWPWHLPRKPRLIEPTPALHPYQEGRSE